MLELMRRNVNGLLGFTLVGALVFVFALSFGQQGSGWGKGQSENIAVSVRGVDIPETTMRYMLNMLGRGRSNDKARVAQMERTAINALIERQLLLDMASEIGISASTKEAEDRIAKGELYLTVPVEDVIRQLSSMFFIDAASAGPALIKDAYRRPASFKTEQGKFDYEHFAKYVKYQLQVTEEEFVEQQRLEIIAERMRQLMVSGIRVSTQEARANYDQSNDTASISYLRLIPTFFADRLNPTPEAFSAWIADNKNRIEQYYETNKYKYTNLEKMAKASHILKKVAEDASEEEKAAARAEIKSILTRLKAGEDFATLAREFSDDPGSAAKGGELGFNPRGRMVPKFDEAMFSLEPGQLSDVVETKFGYHIIKLDSFREGNVTLEEATVEIADQLYKETEGARLAEQTAKEFLVKLQAGSTLEDLVKPQKNETVIEENAEETKQESTKPDYQDLKVRTSAAFSKNTTTIPGVGKAPEIIEAAFNLTMESPVPTKTFVVRGDVFVFVLAKRNKPIDEEFAKQEDKIAMRLTSMKQASWLRARIADLRDSAERSGDIIISERFYSVAAPSKEDAKMPTPLIQKNAPTKVDTKQAVSDKSDAPEKEEQEKAAAPNEKDTPSDEVDTPKEVAPPIVDKAEKKVDAETVKTATTKKDKKKSKKKVKTKPVEAEPTAQAESKPVEAEPTAQAESKPVEAEPKPAKAETKPAKAETKPAETDSNPYGNHPGDNKDKEKNSE